MLVLAQTASDQLPLTSVAINGEQAFRNTSRHISHFQVSNREAPVSAFALRKLHMKVNPLTMNFIVPRCAACLFAGTLSIFAPSRADARSDHIDL